MATTLNITTELVVYEKFPKLCEYITDNVCGDWGYGHIVSYLLKEGYDVRYTKFGGMGRGYSHLVTFNDDKQYLDFVLKYS